MLLYCDCAHDTSVSGAAVLSHETSANRPYIPDEVRHRRGDAPDTFQ